ncbi:MAG: nicotinate-nucleotide--dimethylbenzimidazole phosphoribosyltransferase [Anaerovoracaceae bacterium]
MEKELFDLARTIEPLNEGAMKQALARQETLAKPPGSLGKLEELSVQFAGITGKLYNSVKRKCVIILAADNGVCSEGIASAPQSVTLAQTINFTRRLTGVGALAETFNTDLMVVDVGINSLVPKGLVSTEVGDIRENKIIDRKIAMGTKNLAKEPAMTREEAVTALMTGIELATAAKKMGYDIIGVGEMGIGNTTTSASVLSALTGCDAEAVVGRGGGITDSSFQRKKEIVEAAAKQEFTDTIDILAKVGGFDIAGMAGVFVGAAINKLPVVIDGYISIVAALVAEKIAPRAKAYMIASHESFEIGYGRAIEALGLTPMLKLGMRLGEGSGCPLAFQIIEGALGVMSNMATFEEAEINDDYLEEIRKGNCF